MSNQLATLPAVGNGQVMTAPAAAAPILDKNAIMLALGINAKNPKHQALILTCDRYGLDPILKHAVLISDSLYVTRDGLMHVAHASGRFDGLEVLVEAETQTHYIAVATVWRKDMTRPFRFQGRYPKGGRMAKDYGPEMAEKVAVCRALRHAFDVSLCSREELWEQEPEAVQQGAAAAFPSVPQAQIVQPQQGRVYTNRAPEPREETPPAAAKPAPVKPNASANMEAPLVSALNAFARAARTSGHDVYDGEKPSRSRMLMLFDSMTDESRDPDTFPAAAAWREQAGRMASWTQRQHEIREVAKSLDDDDADMSSPFGPDPGMETSLMDVPAAPVAGTASARQQTTSAIAGGL